MAFACLLTRCNAGSRIASNNAMTAITTKSSIRVNPLFLGIAGLLLFMEKEGFFTPNLYFRHFSRRVLVPAAYLKGARQTAPPYNIPTTKYRPPTTILLYKSNKQAKVDALFLNFLIFLDQLPKSW
jgi:hypothetical protein